MTGEGFGSMETYEEGIERDRLEHLSRVLRERSHALLEVAQLQARLAAAELEAANQRKRAEWLEGERAKAREEVMRLRSNNTRCPKCFLHNACICA